MGTGPWQWQVKDTLALASLFRPGATSTSYKVYDKSPGVFKIRVYCLFVVKQGLKMQESAAVIKCV